MDEWIASQILKKENKLNLLPILFDINYTDAIKLTTKFPNLLRITFDLNSNTKNVLINLHRLSNLRKVKLFLDDFEIVNLNSKIKLDEISINQNFKRIQNDVLFLALNCFDNLTKISLKKSFLSKNCCEILSKLNLSELKLVDMRMECAQTIMKLISQMNLMKLTILNEKSTDNTKTMTLINGIVNNLTNGLYKNLKIIKMNYSPLLTTNYKNLLSCKNLSIIEIYYSALDPIVNICAIIKLTENLTSLQCVFREYL